MRILAATFVLTLVAACNVTPLQRELDPASVGGSAVEFYIPTTSPLGDVVSGLLTQAQADVVRVSLPVVEGSLGGTLEYVTSECELEIPVSDLSAAVQDSKLQISAIMGAAEVNVPLEVYAQGALLRTCFLSVAVPERGLHLQLVFSSTLADGPALVVDGAPDIVGTAVSAELDLDCPEQPGSDVHSLVIGSVEDVIFEAVLEFTSDLAVLAGSAVGTTSGAAGNVEDLVDFLMLPDSTAAGMGAADLRIGLQGGFESARAPCVPADAADLPPSTEPPAEFPDGLPGTGEPYGMGISVSKGFLNQGLAAGYRGGLLCRRAGAGDLSDVRLDDLFPSLRSLGPLSAIRAAVWPGGQPQMEFTTPDPAAGEDLPRMMVTMPRLTVDIYGNLEWTDVRLLSVTADVLVVLSPRLENGSLSFGLVEAHIGSMDINFSKLLDESDEDLRSGAIAAAERMIDRMVLDMGLAELPRPACGGGDLLEAELEGGRILLYFAP
jgi:hypothetical protein